MIDPNTAPIPVELVPHKPEWRQRAASEIRSLKVALGDRLLIVHHIGSTSVPGILAKPIVDLLPVVRDCAALDEIEPDVRALGYDWMGEFGLPGRRYCRLHNPLTGKREVQLHFYAPGNPEIPRHIAFRDYLRTNPAIAKAYEAEKVRAASLQPFDTQAYNAEKNCWIKRTQADALAWAGIVTPVPKVP